MNLWARGWKRSKVPIAPTMYVDQKSRLRIRRRARTQLPSSLVPLYMNNTHLKYTADRIIPPFAASLRLLQNDTSNDPQNALEEQQKKEVTEEKLT